MIQQLQHLGFFWPLLKLLCLPSRQSNFGRYFSIICFLPNARGSVSALLSGNRADLYKTGVCAYDLEGHRALFMVHFLRRSRDDCGIFLVNFGNGTSGGEREIAFLSLPPPFPFFSPGPKCINHLHRVKQRNATLCMTFRLPKERL